MSRPTAPDSLDFLQGDPQPVGKQPRAGRADVLPQAVADALLAIDGVDGAWIERRADGTREVVVHVSRPWPLAAVPKTVAGMPTRQQGGEPIRAQRR